MDFILHFVLTPRQAHSTTWSGCVCLNQPATVNWIILYRHCELLYADADAADAALRFLQWPISRAEQKLVLSLYTDTHTDVDSLALATCFASRALSLSASLALSTIPKRKCCNTIGVWPKSFRQIRVPSVFGSAHTYTVRVYEQSVWSVSVCMPVHVHLLTVCRPVRHSWYLKVLSRQLGAHDGKKIYGA